MIKFDFLFIPVKIRSTFPLHLPTTRARHDLRKTASRLGNVATDLRLQSPRTGILHRQDSQHSRCSWKGARRDGPSSSPSFRGVSPWRTVSDLQCMAVVNLVMSPMRRRNCFLVVAFVVFIPFCAFVLFTVPGKRHNLAFGGLSNTAVLLFWWRQIPAARRNQVDRVLLRCRDENRVPGLTQGILVWSYSFSLERLCWWHLWFKIVRCGVCGVRN